MIVQPAPLGQALARAIAGVREQLAEPLARVGVIVPSEVSGVFLRQQLALVGPFIAVEWLTPERLVRELARPRIPDGWAPEPPAWLRTVTGALLGELADAEALGQHGPALRQAGWRRPVARALERIESAGLGPEALEAIDEPSLRPRARLLGTVLRAVQERRAHERLLSFADLCALARAALDEPGHGPGHRIAGAVVVGDKILGPDVFEVLRGYLVARVHRTISPPPLANLAPAPRGMRAAASGPAEPVVIDESRVLGRVQARLHAAPVPTPATRDDSLALVSTPDEVRDVGEAVREVLRAIRDGVALDQIAVVLPDVAQADVLREALEDAGVAATWLTGPALARAPESRGLQLAVAIATGDDTVEQWYALVSHPSLDLRRAIPGGAADIRGRGRWRRILARCGAVRGTTAIVAAIERWAAAREADEADDREAAASLARVIAHFDERFAGWRTPTTLGGFRQRFDEFLHACVRPSARRERLRTTLSDWGPPGLGVRSSLAEAAAELRDTLAEAADLDGRLTDPRVRVLSPMQCLGGAFARVCVTGLTQKRLPADVREDPLLPDALLDALARRSGATLLTSKVLREFEDRRFAAIVGACTGRLWLASPELELLTERRLLPSRHLLDVFAVIAGRRTGYAQLRQATTRVGSRARPFPSDPDDGIGELEHGVAAARQDPARALRDLAARPSTRRLLGLHRALDAARPTAWTGEVDPSLLRVPGLDDHEDPITASGLQQLLTDPAAYLFGQLLGVRRAARLFDRWDPSEAYAVSDSVRAAITDAVERGDASFAGLLAAWQAAVDARAAANPHVGPEELALARSLAETALTRFCDRAGSFAGAVAIKATQLRGQPFAGLAWQVDASGTWLSPDGVVALRRQLPTQATMTRAAADLILAACLANAQGLPAERVRLYTSNGDVCELAVDDARASVRERAELAAALIRAGVLPRTSDGRLAARLAGEPTVAAFEPETFAALLADRSTRQEPP